MQPNTFFTIKRRRKKLFFRLSVFLLAFLCTVGTYGILRHVVHAAGADYIPLAPLPGTLGTECFEASCEVGKTATLQTYLPGIFKLAIGIAGVLAVIEIIIGGLQYMSTDAIGGKSAGRERITAAIGGLLLALGAYIILNTISPNFVNLNIDIKPVNVTTVETPKPGLPLCSTISSSPKKTCPYDNCATATSSLGALCGGLTVYPNSQACYTALGLCDSGPPS